MFKISLLFSILFVNVLSSKDVCAQKKYGKLKLKVIQTKSFYWNEIEFKNQDTSFKQIINPYMKRPIIDSIPQGKYKAKLISIFGHTVEKQIVIRNKSKLTFKVDKYYQKDKSKINFLERLGNNDTLRISSRQTGCFSFARWSCCILHKDSSFMIVYNSSNGMKKSYLDSLEVNALLNLEGGARKPIKFKYFSTTTTLDSWVLDKQIIEFRQNGPSHIGNLIYQRKKNSSEKGTE